MSTVGYIHFSGGHTINSSELGDTLAFHIAIPQVDSCSWEFYTPRITDSIYE